MPTALGVLVLAATLTSPSVTVQTRDPAPRVTASNRFIVQFQDPPLARRRSGVSAQAARGAIDRFRSDLAGLRHGRIAAEGGAIEHEYFRAFHGVSVTLDPADVDAVRRLAYVRRVVEDAQVKAFGWEDQEHRTRIGADRIWSEKNVRGDGIIVAVLDTGIDYMHPALGGGFGGGFKVVAGHDFVDDDDDPMDEHGHGTHVAGILAGGNDEVRGVAPNATLLAYRVLDADGVGDASDVLEAIEWTVDPNRDGDLSDRADVANVSLGTVGDADSPMSQAVDNATQAGVVFCLSAGNTPGERTIGSPAAARLGITVGSSDANDLLAPYSSRGPSYPDWGLKPEVIAPGSAILSARLGGGTVIFSGTSMAAPHVAGAAALLLQLHPDWSPADVKAALVGSATPIAEQVMGQGGGRIDIPAAAAMGGAIAPAVVAFGRHGGKDAWTSTRTVRLTNRGAGEETFRATFTTPQDVVVTAEPAELTLAPGASADVLLSASFSAAAGAALQTLSHGGLVAFTSAHDTVRLPWVAVDAARVTITHEIPSTLVWACDRGPGTPQIDGGTSFDLLLPNSRCELFTIAVPFGLGGATVIYRSLVVDDDAALALTAADANLEVRLGGVDRHGTLVSSPGFSLEAPYSSSYDIQFPPGSKIGGWILCMLSSEPLRTSDLPEGFTLTVSEMLFDLPKRSLYAIHHPQLHGVHESTTLSSLPSDLRHGRVTVAPQRPGTTLSASIGYMSQGLFRWSGFYLPAPLENGWSADLYVTPDRSPTSWGNVGLFATRGEEEVSTDWMTPMFRAVGEGIVVSNDPIPSPAAHRVAANGTMATGETPLHPETVVNASGTAFSIFPGMVGPMSELAVDATAGFTYELRDGAGLLLREGTAESVGVVRADFGSLGAYRANLRMKNGQQTSLTFDTSLPDLHPPSITSLRIVDGQGRIVSQVPRAAPATLQFSAYDLAGGFPDFTEPRTTRVSWRSADGPWHELPLDVVLRDFGNPAELGYYATGVHYRADLGPITASPYRSIDLRIELEDASGNASTTILEDALEIGGRRRAAGK